MNQAKSSARHPPTPPPENPHPPEPVVPWGSEDHLETALRVPGWELRPQLCFSCQQSACPWDRRAVNRHSRWPPLYLTPRKSRTVNCFFFLIFIGVVDIQRVSFRCTPK